MMGRLLLAAISLVALGWGMFETVVLTNRHAWASVDRDISLAVPRRLAEISRASASKPDTQEVVLYFNLDHADISPVIAHASSGRSSPRCEPRVPEGGTPAWATARRQLTVRSQATPSFGR